MRVLFRSEVDGFDPCDQFALGEVFPFSRTFNISPGVVKINAVSHHTCTFLLWRLKEWLCVPRSFHNGKSILFASISGGQNKNNTLNLDFVNFLD